MPRTGKEADGSAVGLDIAVARLVCEKLGRPLEIHWCASPACSRNCLRDRRCDVILGQPFDDAAPNEIAWSVPYAGSRFGMVVPRGATGVRSLTDMAGKRVGIVAGTVALPESQHKVVRYQSREEVLDKFASDQLDAAFLDADFAAWHLHSHPKLELRLVEEYVPREHWNMALAARAADAGLLVEINKALAELAAAGQLEIAYAKLGVPFRPPFTASARQAAAVDTWKRIQERGELRICFDPANLPYSSAKDDQPGFDLELARQLAQEIGLKLRVEWLDVQRDTAIGKVLENECDLAFGAAVDPNAVEDEEELAGKVIYSQPYYGSGYVLVTRKDGPRVKALAELRGEQSRRLGAEAGSVADYRLRQGGLQRSLFRNQLAVLKALNDGGIDYAYLWANVGWTLHATPDFALEIVPDYLPEDHWNIAVAMRLGDEELKRRVDVALARLAADGAVARALAGYHVPFFPPFDDKQAASKPQNVPNVQAPESVAGGVSGSGPGQAGPGGLAGSGVIRHPVANRGLEPQMQKVQSSRKPYGGLARVRSAGTLVVGLDQNNLPFSTSHPEPAGLDYDIAGLLAKKLGLSLSVYWAYSSHDSYPSKLTSKKLCDVILGVMPDDRFGDRVLFSKPYCTAGYQLVVSSSAGAPTGFEGLGDDPLAIEAGIAVNGLADRPTRVYPSLDSILEAVSANQAKAGYVISAKGHWLAESRWPAKLQFLDGDPNDRFPICAAVRKGDKDLQSAIDVALAELDASGELGAVFDRWHVPYLEAGETR